MRKSQEKLHDCPQPESPAGQSPLKIPYEPVPLVVLIERAKRVKEIVEELEKAKRVPPEVMRKEFVI